MRPKLSQHSLMLLTKCDQVDSNAMMHRILPKLSLTLSHSSHEGSPLSMSGSALTSGSVGSFSLSIGNQSRVSNGSDNFKCEHFGLILGRNKDNQREMQDLSSQQGISYVQEQIKLDEEKLFKCFKVDGATNGVGSIINHIDRVFQLHDQEILNSAYVDFTRVKLPRYEKSMNQNMGPSPGFYLNRKTEMEVDTSVCTEDSRASADTLRPTVIIDELHQIIKNFLEKSLEKLNIFSTIIEEFNFEQLSKFKHGDIKSYVSRVHAYQQLREMVNFQVEIHMEHLAFNEFGNLCTFMQKNSLFHRIWRFEKLCEWMNCKIMDEVIPYVRNAVLHKLNQYLTDQWDFYEPTGELSVVRIMEMFAALDHLFITQTFHYFMAKVTEIGAPWNNDDEVNAWLVEDKQTGECRRFMNRTYRMLLFQLNTLLSLFNMQSDKQKSLLRKNLKKLTEVFNVQFESGKMEDWELSFWNNAFLDHMVIKGKELQTHAPINIEVDLLDVDQSSPK